MLHSSAGGRSDLGHLVSGDAHGAAVAGDDNLERRSLDAGGGYPRACLRPRRSHGYQGDREREADHPGRPEVPSRAGFCDGGQKRVPFVTDIAKLG